ncbi:MAG: UDP-N-acetylglucosamine 2-epimerase (non-hydrolyzing) [Flavobacteriales bacterium]|nr:UDP-N-acetylglucosamine 2-epimerase (non-hydrolyzing) [Flavobacteriales bacterium]MCX7767538.1 UDP-N-acetylglucosamine 2-epimerase (non-hydrolyzing) [Flavobacteriales bacterium]MDW8410389.1 UDP-N-acetylglucosamine 2-epimerase (non-hydrolyzing) [Flavobacteriales bacterium]
MKKKILNILGTRPQIIKWWALHRFLKESDLPLHIYTLHTSQHYDENMSEIFYKEFELPLPDFHLNTKGLSRLERMEEMLRGIREAADTVKPEILLIYGDTDSTLAGALAGELYGIPVAHVEAGLRSNRRDMPEEFNRVASDRIATLLLCPTHRAIRNLEAEGITRWAEQGLVQVIFSGDVMLDNILFLAPRLDSLNAHGPFAFMTLHRNYNTDDPARLKAICQAVSALAENIPIVFPVHPRTRQKLQQFGLEFSERVKIMDPLGFMDTLRYVKAARFVFTDSGGLQKEACFLGKPVLILRGETEWLEILEEKAGVLAGDNPDHWPMAYQELTKIPTPVQIRGFGDGRAACIICEALINFSSR